MILLSFFAFLILSNWKNSQGVMCPGPLNFLLNVQCMFTNFDRFFQEVQLYVLKDFTFFFYPKEILRWNRNIIVFYSESILGGMFIQRVRWLIFCQFFWGVRLFRRVHLFGSLEYSIGPRISMLSITISYLSVWTFLFGTSEGSLVEDLR